MKLNSALFLTIMLSISIAGSISSCAYEFTGDEDRATLLRQAAVTFKGPFWPESCAASHPACPFSRERRSHEAIMVALQIPPYNVSSNRAKHCCLECRKSCSHPASCIGLGTFALSITALCCLEHIFNINVPYACAVEGSTLTAPAGGFALDYCCLAYLTNPNNWDDNTPDGNFGYPEGARDSNDLSDDLS